MRKRRAVCLILALIMITMLCACDRAGKVGEELNTPSETGSGESAKTAEEASAAISVSPEAYEDRQGLVVLDWEDYVTRPDGIQPGSVFNYGVTDGTAFYVPWYMSADAGWLWQNVFEGLLYMYMDDPEDIRGCIAERWEHSDDYLTWTFQIRNGVKFTDGTVCDAYAIAKTWDIMLTEDTFMDYSGYNLASWEAMSAREFVVRLSAPCAWFEVALCSQAFAVVSPTALELHGVTGDKAAVGTGPYYFDTIPVSILSNPNADRTITLRANPDYYLAERQPSIETVNFRYFWEQDEMTKALLSGEIAGAILGDADDRRSGNTGKRCVLSYRVLTDNGYAGSVVPVCGDAYQLWLNPERVEAFKLSEAREAMCRFIDFDAINSRIFGGLGRVQDSLWAAGTSGYVPTDQFYYDPSEGRELLASVGLEASDIKFDVYVIQFDNMLAEIAGEVQSELEAAGVTMNLTLDVPETSTFADTSKMGLYIDNLPYSSEAPHLPWTYILKPDALLRRCRQDLYNPELYQEMLDEYDAMTTAATWDDMLAHQRNLTTYVQDDFGAFGTVQPPEILALGKGFRNGVYFSEDHNIQLYYLYQ